MKNSTRKFVLCAMLSAMCAVLGYISIDLTAVKITFESLPILLAGLMFGPACGATVGAVGTLIYQLLRYGFTATTLLWMLPYVIMGFAGGLFAKKRSYSLSPKQTIIATVVLELLVTVLNTGVIYVDSKLYGYYSLALITGSLLIRLSICIVKGILFGIALNPLIGALKREA